MTNQLSWIHKAGDGRVPRDVFLNGNLVEYVVYADEKKGKVVVFRYPFELDKYKKRILRHTIYGSVVVRTKSEE